VLEASHEDGGVEDAPGPEIEEVHALDATGERERADPLRHKRMLIARERDSVDADPPRAGVLEERPPAAAHVEDLHARLEPEGVERVLELSGLGGREIIVRARVEAVRVGARAIQPCEEEVGRTVIVMRDRAPAEPAAIDQPAQPPEQLAQPRGRFVCEVVRHEDHVLEGSLDVDPLVEIGLGEGQVVAVEERLDRAGVPKPDARAILSADGDRLDAGRLDHEARSSFRQALREVAQLLCAIRIHVGPFSRIRLASAGAHGTACRAG